MSTSQFRLGGFVTMMVALLLFFGMVSRIGKPGDPSELLLSARVPPPADPKVALLEARKKTVAVYGLKKPEPASAAEPIARPKLPTPEPEAPKQEPAPQAPQVEPETPSPAPKPKETPASHERHYVVKPGDTLWQIAANEYGDGAMHALIEQANPGVDSSSLRVGQALTLPEARTAMGQTPAVQP